MLGGGGRKEALAWRGGGVAGGWRMWGVFGWLLSRRGKTSKSGSQNNSTAPPTLPRGSIVPEANAIQHTVLRTTGTLGNARVVWIKHA